MTIDEAIKAINEAAPGTALDVAEGAIDKLSDGDKMIAAGDLEEMAISIDELAI